MFYEALGALLGQAGSVMTRPDFGRAPDERSAREVRQIGLLLLRVQAVWPALTRTLLAEVQVLRRGLDEANVRLLAHGLEPVAVEDAGDPYSLHRDLERAIDLAIQRLADRVDEGWPQPALAALRRSLAESAELQGRLVDEMLSIRLPAKTAGS